MSDLHEPIKDYQDLTLKFERRRKNFIRIYFKVKDAGTNIKQRNDARLTLLVKCIEALSNLEIGLMNIHYATKDPVWIYKYPFNLLNDDLDNVRYSHQMFFKFAFIHLYFSGIESSLRLFLKSIDPNACNNSTAEFESIYTAFFKRLSLQQYLPLMDLFRCIRNTIHNNGVYNPKSQTNKDITYKGKNYKFLVSISQEHTLWTDLLFLVDETTLMIDDILSNSWLMNNPLPIEDPFSSQIWPKYNNMMNKKRSD